MRVTTSDSGYVIGWCDIGDDTGLLCEAPEDFDHFVEYYPAYVYSNGKLILDESKLKEIELEHMKNRIRLERQEVCFPYINRGVLWYSMLTQDQREQLGAWYQAWLDAPETMTIPEKLEWLN